MSELGIDPVVIEDRTGSSAYHIPNGTLLIYDPANRSPKPGYTQISTEDIAPTILQNYSVPVSGYMRNAVPLASESHV
jgi:hypothetical protein